MSHEREKPRPIESLAPARNFSLNTADLVRAAAGPPAYARRKREIEDLEGILISEIVARTDAPEPEDSRADAGKIDLGRLVKRINDLIERHNRYYPMEANLPVDPLTGVLLERGAPWKPMPLVTLETLIEKARAARNSKSA